MKIRCEKFELVNAIGAAMKAVPNKTTVPIQECVVLEAGSGRITITSNNLEMGIMTILEGDIEETGRVAIDAKLLNELAPKLPPDDVTISVDENYTVHVKCGKSKFDIPGRDAEIFTFLPETEKGLMVSVNQDVFKNAVAKTIFCVSKEANNVMMTGEKIEVRQNRMTLYALDGHRVAVNEIQLASAYKDCDAVIPGRTLSELCKILKDGQMQVEFTKDHITFHVDGTKLVSRTIFGTYFDVNRVLPKEWNTTVKIYAQDLLSCLGRSSVTLRQSEKKPLILDISGNEINFFANTSLGKFDETMDVYKEGEDLKIGVNNRFMMDAIGAAASFEDELEMRFINMKSPITITKDDASYKYIVLPVNF